MWKKAAPISMQLTSHSRPNSHRRFSFCLTPMEFPFPWKSRDYGHLEWADIKQCTATSLTSLDWNNLVIAKNASVASVLPINSPCIHISQLRLLQSATATASSNFHHTKPDQTQTIHAIITHTNSIKPPSTTTAQFLPHCCSHSLASTNAPQTL